MMSPVAQLTKCRPALGEVLCSGVWFPLQLGVISPRLGILNAFSRPVQDVLHDCRRRVGLL